MLFQRRNFLLSLSFKLKEEEDLYKKDTYYLHKMFNLHLTLHLVFIERCYPLYSS